MARRERRGRREPHVWPVEGPRPGDPSSTGPRPRPRLRDGFWLALASALVLVTVLQVIRLVWTIATDDRFQVSGGGAFLGFLVTVVWFLTIYWVAAGAWRRSVWGCPFQHTEDAHYDRRCQRHPLVPAAEPALYGAGAAGSTASSDPTSTEPTTEGPTGT